MVSQSVIIARRGRKGDRRHNFNFRTKQGPTISVSIIRDIAFFGCSEMLSLIYFKLTKSIKIYDYITKNNYITSSNTISDILIKVISLTSKKSKNKNTLKK